MSELKTLIETNPLVYTGEVTIRKIKNGVPYKVVKRKNASTKAFHNFLLNCMIGNYDSDSAPSKIAFFEYDTKSETTKNDQTFGKAYFRGVSTTTSPIEGKVEHYINSPINTDIDIGSSEIYYHFLIPETYSGNQFNVVELLNNKDQVLALISTENGELFKTEEGLSLDITWKITLSNK